MEENEIELIISKYESELRYVAFTYVRNWDVVDDMMQEVFLKVFLKFNSFKEKSNLKTWLYTITRNQCIDYLRSKVVKANILVDNMEVVKCPSIESVETEIIEKLDKERLHQHITSLPTDYKETLFLYYFDDYTYTEISKILCKDISFVKNKLYRGRRLLKKVYQTND